MSKEDDNHTKNLIKSKLKKHLEELNLQLQQSLGKGGSPVNSAIIMKKVAINGKKGINARICPPAWRSVECCADGGKNRTDTQDRRW